jgi:hypothetical protein
MLCAVSEPPAGDQRGDAPAAGKGRPTPKRRDAQKRRRQPMPGNKKEAAKLRRERAREVRALQRKALQSGDEKHLPARDAGPAKRLARDLVDSRFTLGQTLFGLIVVSLLAAVVTTPSTTKDASGKVVKQANTLGALVTILSILALIAIFVDAMRIGRKARRTVAERFGDKQSFGITGYAAIRAMQPRRLRRPPPMVKRGGSPR